MFALFIQDGGHLIAFSQKQDMKKQDTEATKQDMENQ
jgi:hypothetical protein